jgi:Calx-beta domain
MINRKLFLPSIGLAIEIVMCGCSTNTAHDSSANSSATPPSGTNTSSPSLGSQNAAQGQLSFLAPTYAVDQSAGTVVITASRVDGSSDDVTVSYKTANGTASAGTNYTSSNGTLSWTNGDSANKTFVVPIANSIPFAGSKIFTIELLSPSGTATLGTPSTTTVTINGADANPSPSTTIVSKSISEWVACDGLSDDTAAVALAFEAARNNAFTLVVDCPVRLHTGSEISTSITIEDGTTVKFTGTGEFRVDNASPPAFEVPNPQAVSLVDWSVKYVGS